MGNKAYRHVTKKSTATNAMLNPDRDKSRQPRQRPWMEPTNRKERRRKAKLERSIRACTAEANRRGEGPL